MNGTQNARMDLKVVTKRNIFVFADSSDLQYMDGPSEGAIFKQVENEARTSFVTCVDSLPHRHLT